MTLELSNVASLPIKLWPGMKTGQLCLFRFLSSGTADRLQFRRSETSNLPAVSVGGGPGGKAQAR